MFVEGDCMGLGASVESWTLKLRPFKHRSAHFDRELVRRSHSAGPLCGSIHTNDFEQRRKSHSGNTRVGSFALFVLYTRSALHGAFRNFALILTNAS